jgi:hypothetical protein
MMIVLMTHKLVLQVDSQAIRWDYGGKILAIHYFIKDGSSHKSHLLLLKKFSQNSLESTTLSSLSFGGFLYKALSFSFGPAKRRTLFFLFGVSRLVV